MATATTTPRLESLRSAKLKEALTGYGFVLVPMGYFLVFFIFPIVYAVYISFYDWGILGKIEPVGLDNYRLLLEDELFRRSLKNVAYYTAVVVPCQIALGLFLAVIVNNALRFRAFFRAAFYFPALASSAAITAIAIYLLSADGLVNQVLGTDQPWLGDSDTALESIMALNIWTTSGTMMLFYLAALQSIPTDVYEAAAIDKAGVWRTFWKITFPLLKPGHFFVAVISIIGSNRSWFGDPDTALWSIVGLNAWTTAGTVMLFYLAALQAIPTDVYEAAAIDGTSRWRTFWRITFPLLKPAHFFVLVVFGIGALKVFDQAFIVSGGTGGPVYSTYTAVLYIYNEAFKSANFGVAASAGVVLFVAIFILTVIQRATVGRAEIG